MRVLPLNKPHSLDLAPGEALVLSGIVRETHESHTAACPSGSTSVYESAHDGDRNMAFIDQPITYEMLQGGQFLSRSIPMVSRDDDSGTSATLFVEISVNCAGSGRGICRAGSLCANDEDCETGHCEPDEDDDSQKRCVDYCGDADPSDAGEACDDGNTVECGTCNSTCTEPISGPLCAGGTGCRTSADCASGSCVPVPFSPTGAMVCTSACGNGWIEGTEACDDNNTMACGTCNPSCTAPSFSPTGCANGVECRVGADCTSGSCEDGVCGPLCGNGVTEAGELCDDGNTLTCGSCDPTCDAATTPVVGCAAGLGCDANTDCTSASCVGGICQ
jgi:cysteine-rich repeat protein